MTPTHFRVKHTLILFFLLFTTLFSPQTSSIQASHQNDAPDFTPDDCMIDLPAGVVKGEDVICGYLSVPEEYDNPNGPTIRLAVIIIKSQNTNPKLDPLFMAQGGPGGSTIDTYTEVLLTDSRLLKDRDIVLFDQRGTLYSEPNLVCSEINDLVLETIEQDLSPEDAQRLEQEATQACRDRFIDEGINLSAFDSIENAKDLNALRNALEYKEINLYGVSYGTLLALHVIQQNPEILRSVILDAVVPPQNNFILEAAQSMDRSFTRLFQACGEDPNCARAFPDLENVFFDLVAQLDETPARVPMTDPDSGITYKVLINGETFQSGLFQLLYATSLIPVLPRMIYDARDGEFGFFSRIMSVLIFDRSTSYGMYYTVLCAEDADFEPSDQDLRGLRPQIVEVEQRGPTYFQEICKSWNVDPLGPQVDNPVTSDIPSLILSGEFDPITPPHYGQIVASTLPNSFSFTFPAGGHGQAFEGECQDSIILSFLDNPNTQPDGNCINKIDKPDFLTDSNLINVPVIPILLNLEGNSGYELLLLLASLAFLLSAILVFPTTWAIRSLREKSAKRRQILNESSSSDPHIPTDFPIPPLPIQPLIIKLARWLAVFTGVLILVFLIGLVAVLIDMVLKNDNRLFFGVTAHASGLFLLPIFSALLSLGMLGASISTWLKRYWFIWERIYYTFLTLSAFISISILAKWGILTALILL